MVILKTWLCFSKFSRHFLQWKQFIAKQHQLQESQSSLQHTVDMHLLTCSFMYWKHAHRCSQLSKDIALRRQKAWMVGAFNEWRHWTWTCRADRHRNQNSLRKVWHLLYGQKSYYVEWERMCKSHTISPSDISISALLMNSTNKHVW